MSFPASMPLDWAIALLRVAKLGLSEFAVFDDRGGTGCWKLAVPEGTLTSDAKPITTQMLKTAGGELCTVAKEDL
jgi:hypothetical protein